MVFQSYALYPHMTVYENMAFSLKVAELEPAEIGRRVKAAAEILRLDDYLDRRTSQLSGGQRQRVAMGRAIVREPEVFLFDEPLSNLDAAAAHGHAGRDQRLHHQLGTTAVYVTHDQIEAMTMADRIVIMRDGLIEQHGAPLDVFERPANAFVARFIGSPAMNMLPGRLVAHAGGMAVDIGTAEAVPVRGCASGRLEAGQAVILGVRPEDIVPEGHGLDPTSAFAFRAAVTLTESLGNETLIFTTLAGTEVISRMARPRPWSTARCSAFWSIANGCISSTESRAARCVCPRAIPGKVATVFRPELRKNKDLERSTDSKKRSSALASHQGGDVDHEPFFQAPHSLRRRRRSAGLGGTCRRRDRHRVP